MYPRAKATRKYIQYFYSRMKMCTSSTTIKDCVFKLDGHLKLKCNLDQLKKGEINKQIKYLKTELNSDLINIFNSSLYLHTLHCVTFTLRRIIV